MKRSYRWRFIIIATAALAAFAYKYATMTTPWVTISTTFAKTDKPYGGGDFHIRGNDVISLKLADPETPFKPMAEWKNPDVAEHTEAWMDNSGERLNRGTVRFLRGTLSTGLTRTFEQRAQDAAWWYSKNWQNIYVSTGWMDYKVDLPLNALAPQITKLWQSKDSGTTWTQLSWPENQNIDRLLFLDAQRGYAIGWGPHIWRTSDGGQSWQPVKLPPLLDFPATSRRTFDAVNLGPDGMLRVAYYVQRLGDIQTSSLVYQLAWAQPDFTLDMVLPQQTVADLQTDDIATGQGYKVYALTRLGPPRDYNDSTDKGHRTGALSSWSADHHQATATQLQTFNARLTLNGLSVGRQGVMLVYTTDASDKGIPHDLTLLSKDAGKSWDELNDGMAQGGYFDPETNTQYGLYAYSLKKRIF